MGNPLISRRPPTLEEYRVAGVRYVVVNSQGVRATQQSESSERDFPRSRASTAASGRRPKLLHHVSPSARDARGLDIWIHDIAPTAPDAWPKWGKA